MLGVLLETETLVALDDGGIVTLPDTDELGDELVELDERTELLDALTLLDES